MRRPLTLGDVLESRPSESEVVAEVLEAGGIVEREGAPVPDEVGAWLSLMYPRTVTRPMGDHHLELWEWVEEIEASAEHVDPFVAAWSRGGAKSSSAELAVARLGLTGRRGYAWIVRATQANADKMLANVAHLLEAESVAIHYPEHADRKLSKYGHSRGWNSSRLRTAGGLTVDAIGLDTAARGLKVEDLRPDLIVLDDVDGKEDTERATAKKLRTITHSVLPAGTAATAVLVAQNLIIPNGIVSRLVDGRADFLARRRVSGPVPALLDMEVEAEQTPEGFSRAVIVGGSPTWEGQTVAECQALMDLIGLTSFRQECQHEVHSRVGALWSEDMILRDFDVPDLVRVVVGVDPSGGRAEIGIVAAGIDAAGVVWILADRTQPGARGVKNWASASVSALAAFNGDRVVAERNFGGDMVEAVLRAEDETVPVKLVNASRGKRLRAEPVAALYERGRVRHAGYFPALEAEMCGWLPDDPTSPNRLDALVWAVTALALGKRRRVQAFVPGMVTEDAA